MQKEIKLPVPLPDPYGRLGIKVDIWVSFAKNLFENKHVEDRQVQKDMEALIILVNQAYRFRARILELG